VDLLAHAADHTHRLAKIHLPMTRRVRQRHEGLAAPCPRNAHMVLHHRVAPGKAMLVAQPLEDSFCRVPLLHRRRKVRLQDRVDHRQQRTQLRLCRRRLAGITRRQRKPAHLANRLTAQPKNPGGLSPAAPKTNNLTNGRILLRPHQHKVDAPMAWFVTAMHTPDSNEREPREIRIRNQSSDFIQ
jgi:hypothetical protein